jgi:hypothetical protein
MRESVLQMRVAVAKINTGQELGEKEAAKGFLLIALVLHWAVFCLLSVFPVGP